MSTIDPSTIDPTKPAQGLPLTANVRANEQATQDNFAAAKADIEALEAQPAGREIQNEGVPLADQTLGAFNIAGNAISVSQNVPQDRYDITANNAVINQVGGGAEVFIGDVGADPVTRELRTFIAGTGATVTQTATEIIIGATGAGGGEVNSAENIGVGLPIALEVNNGTLIPIRSLDASVFEESAGVITISAQTFADWTVAESHYLNSNIHFPVSSLPGNGLQQNGTALDVGAGAGITVNATNVAVTGAPTTKGDLWSYTTGPASLGVGSNGEVLTANSAAASGLEWAVPAGGGDMLSPVAAVAAGELYISTDTSGAQTAGAGFPASSVLRNDVENVIDANELEIAPTSGSTGTLVKVRGSSAAPTAVTTRYLPTNGTPDQRAWSFAATSGAFRLSAINDAETGFVTGFEIDHVTKIFDVPIGTIQEQGVRVYSPNNPPPAGGGNVSSPGTTLDTVQLGDTGATDIKNGPALATMVRTDTAVTIGEVGYQFTSTDLTPQGATITPTYGANQQYLYAPGAPATSVTVTTDASAEGSCEVTFSANTDAVGFTTAPDAVYGSDDPGAVRKLIIDRVGTLITATWKSNG